MHVQGFALARRVGLLEECVVWAFSLDFPSGIEHHSF